jgi:hypothetical protein
MIPTQEDIECRRQDLFREAEGFREARRLRDAQRLRRGPGGPAHRRLRAALGTALIRAGHRLAATEPSVATGAPRGRMPAQT